MSASAGMKLFGRRAVAVMFKELKQLVDLEVFSGIDSGNMTEEEV